VPITAQIGTVASALRYLAKQVMTGVTGDFTGDFDIGKVRHHLTADRGIGIDLIVHFLAAVPGVNQNSVKDHLAILKASGDYGRIIDEVTTEIERENADAIKALEKADRVTGDFPGDTEDRTATPRANRKCGIGDDWQPIRKSG
jgi:Ethanolamine utilization protein EutJ (predicted chaperonin)